MNICLDAGLLIGLYDERDRHHQRSLELFDQLFDSSTPNVAVVVWPILYESVSTRLVRHRGQIVALERDWRRLVSERRLEFLDDVPYRAEALELCFQELAKPPRTYRDLSLTDRVLRAVLADDNVQIEGIATFNPADFVDVCRSTNRTMFS